MYAARMELWKILKPLELFIVDIIIEKTIGWRTKAAKFTIEELKEKTGQKHTHIYPALKKLESMGIIFRQKQKHDLIIGLNENYFGGLLIKKHEDADQARRNKIKIVVNNVSESRTENVPNSNNSCADSVQDMNESGTQKEAQPHEIIEESSPLKTFFKDISLKTFLKESPKETNVSRGTREQQSQWLKETNGEIDFQVWLQERMKVVNLKCGNTS